MGRGVFNNDSCIRCGACCIDLEIPLDNSAGPKFYKRRGEVCIHLEYNPITNITSCDVYNNNKPRPQECKAYFCDTEDRERQNALRGSRRNMRTIFEKRFGKETSTCQTQDPNHKAPESSPQTADPSNFPQD